MDMYSGETTLSNRDLLSFRLAQRTYALPLGDVVQIIPMVALTPLPQAHVAVEGVMNYRGTAAPIVNLRRYLGLPEVSLKLHTPIILVRTNLRLVGLIVDEVLDVTSVQAQRVVSLTDIMPEGLGGIPILEGLLHTHLEAVLLLDLPQLFAAANLQSLTDEPSNGQDPHPKPVEMPVVENVL